MTYSLGPPLVSSSRAWPISAAEVAKATAYVARPPRDRPCKDRRPSSRISLLAGKAGLLARRICLGRLAFADFLQPPGTLLLDDRAPDGKDGRDERGEAGCGRSDVPPVPLHAVSMAQEMNTSRVIPETTRRSGRSARRHLGDRPGHHFRDHRAR
jgi:hypothetical protein